MASVIPYMLWLLLLSGSSPVCSFRTRKDMAFVDRHGPDAENVARSMLKAVGLSATIAKNCLPTLSSQVQALESTGRAMPTNPSSLTDVVPLLKALKDIVATISSEMCLKGAKEPWPEQFAKALDSFISGTDGVVALQDSLDLSAEILNLSTEVRKRLEDQNYNVVGVAVSALLGALASHAGAMPLLESVAGEFGATQEQVRILVSCASLSDTMITIAKGMQVSLARPEGKFLVGVTPGDFVRKFQEIASLMRSMQDLLGYCLPEQFENDERVEHFGQALQPIDQIADLGQRGAKSLSVFGKDLIAEFQGMHGAFWIGNWTGFGKKLGGIINFFANAEAGVNALDQFFTMITGAKIGDSWRPDKWAREAHFCVVSHENLVATCQEAFRPRVEPDILIKSEHVLKQLSFVLRGTQDMLQTCSSGNVQAVATLLRPEFVAMNAVLDTAFQKARDDTQLLVQGLDLTIAVRTLVSQINARELDSASRQFAFVLKILDDQVNTKSFLSGLLNKLDIGWETLPECIGDVHKVGDHLRTAVFALEISPRKWTIDKGDVDVAMSALREVAKASYDAASSCKKQIDALWQLFKGLMQHQWQVLLGKIELFNADIGKPLWTLGKAVVDRDWVLAGQQVATLALVALDSSEKS